MSLQIDPPQQIRAGGAGEGDEEIDEEGGGPGEGRDDEEGGDQEEAQDRVVGPAVEAVEEPAGEFDRQEEAGARCGLRSL